MKWKKLGSIFLPDGTNKHMLTYARLPIVDYYRDNLFYIYFGSRDKTNREKIFKLLFDIESMKVEKVYNEPILDFGDELGLFDDNGVSPCCIVNVGEKKYLYYVGWNIHVKIPFTCAIGLAISEDEGMTYKKQFKGAVLDRDRFDPQFVAVNDVIYDNCKFKTWYLSAISWKQQDNRNLRHYYNIKYAESLDGIDWKKNNDIVIDFKNEYEYAISTPRIIKNNNLYKMWYSYRGQQGIDTYRIGYAESKDGKRWIRKDEEVGIDVSSEGWDSEMICYPYVFEHKEKKYMLYNGNGYGRTGFGLAILEEE